MGQAYTVLYFMVEIVSNLFSNYAKTICSIFILLYIISWQSLLLAQNKKNSKNTKRHQEDMNIVIGGKIEKLKLYVECVEHTGQAICVNCQNVNEEQPE